MAIDGYTRLAGVLANPIKHSISPMIHNLAFKLTKENGAYLAFEIAPNELEESINNIKRLDMWGLNLSMPYKQAAMQYVDRLTPSAEMIGAINTIVHHEGQLIGHSTDGTGFFRSLPDFDVRGKSLVVLGAGGAGSAIIAQAALDGAKKIHVFNRTSARYATLREQLNRIAERAKIEITLQDITDYGLLYLALRDSQLLVNATPIGMDGKAMPVPESLELRQDILVADIIYQPLETPFIKWAKQQGNPVVGGLGMLLYQAAESFELWTGKAMPVEEIKQRLLQLHG